MHPPASPAPPRHSATFKPALPTVAGDRRGGPWASVTLRLVSRGRGPEGFPELTDPSPAPPPLVTPPTHPRGVGDGQRLTPPSSEAPKHSERNRPDSPGPSGWQAGTPDPQRPGPSPESPSHLSPRALPTVWPAALSCPGRHSQGERALPPQAQPLLAPRQAVGGPSLLPGQELHSAVLRDRGSEEGRPWPHTGLRSPTLTARRRRGLRF